MATTTKSDLAVFESLSIVKLDGFETEKKETELVDDNGGHIRWLDETDYDSSPGSANYLISGQNYPAQGLAGEDYDAAQPGVLWSDCDEPEWQFRVLIASDEVDSFRDLAEKAGYSILSVTEVSEPDSFGDGTQGTVEILKHRDGWVIAK